MLEALFALCRKTVENEPLKIFMATHDMDRNRAGAALAGHGGPPGARLPRLRQPVRRVQRIAAARATNPSSSFWIPWRRSTNHATRCSAPMRPAPSRRWWRCGRSWSRQQTIADRPRRRSVLWRSPAPFAQVRNDRELFDAGRDGVKRCWPPPAAPRDGQRARRSGCWTCWPAPRNRATRKRARRWTQEIGAHPGSAAHCLARHAVPAGRPSGERCRKGES